MQRSKVELFAHLVWATHGRQPFVSLEIEREIYGCIRGEVMRLKCEVLALNGMPDHVHLVVKLHSMTAVARLAQAIKGVSSQMANDELGFEGTFDWQDHYAAFSVSRSHLKRVIGYVDRQKERHQAGRLWAQWEETEMESDFEVGII